MTIPLMLGLLATFGCAAIAAGIASLRGSLRSRNPRLWPAVFLSLPAIAFGILGLNRLHFVSTRRVNGQVQWHLDSNPFFAALLVLGLVALAVALWQARKRMAPPTPDPVR